jgi:hypothetical protein
MGPNRRTLQAARRVAARSALGPRTWTLTLERERARARRTRRRTDTNTSTFWPAASSAHQDDALTFAFTGVPFGLACDGLGHVPRSSVSVRVNGLRGTTHAANSTDQNLCGGLLARRWYLGMTIMARQRRRPRIARARHDLRYATGRQPRQRVVSACRSGNDAPSHEQFLTVALQPAAHSSKRYPTAALRCPHRRIAIRERATGSCCKVQF